MDAEKYQEFEFWGWNSILGLVGSTWLDASSFACTMHYKIALLQAVQIEWLNFKKLGLDLSSTWATVAST